MIPGTQNQAATDSFWEKFERLEKEIKNPSWLFPIRKASIARFAELGFPTLKDEDWRFTNVGPITKLPFKPVFTYSKESLNEAAINQFAFTSLKSSKLVFVNGHFSKELSHILPQKDGIKVGSLAAALEADSALLEKHLGRYVKPEGTAFSALNTAFFHDGAFIHVPAGKVIEEPVHLLFVTTSKEPGTTVHPRNLIIAERGSQATVIESYVSTVDGPYFTNVVSEMVIGEDAVVEHCKFQDESPEAFHIAAVNVQLGKGCNFIAHSIALGAKLSRNNIWTNLDAERVECVLNGLYLTKDEQLADNHMIVEHAKPHCNSHEYYNGILAGKSRGVFHGRILVRPDAQKTDAKQTNKNLLLSDDATIDTKPQLEIYADDVKCTHGATVGQLNEESIFYLRARGIGKETARRMLIHSFAGEIIARVRNAALREELDAIVWDRLEQNALAGEKK
ncbi:Fe-S cluster assembly protein SufD [Pedosphaera parvula]|uniref:FeS assembly protein SufD n=1 Tax=Pedosphaera parvula (strain Ellin514) TaxID=320771 RepID=B9XEV6_PEDPL|nr:Fe-S cluster assembly protein SufD [Pedosphaera parvula]EEF61820.1 FeS assembly protein SufD [Pedosphaera parvula Ellin514]